MSLPYFILTLILGYFSLLFVISRKKSRGDNFFFFTGGRNAHWLMISVGMIGASLSGVTFISIPGWVKTQNMAYMQMVLGYLAGYAIIATILLPLYYRLQLISIYQYLKVRFGPVGYKTGASFFILSRLFGAGFRLYLVALILHTLVFEHFGWPFWATVSLSIGMIYLYTQRGGIGTIIYTDVVQTVFMLGALIATVTFIWRDFNMSDESLFGYIYSNPLSKVWFFDHFLSDGRHFVKQFLGGMFIAITMTGLDQDMMQKNLACRNLKDAQKNMMLFSVMLLPVNLIFLSLGVLLYDWAALHGIEATGDRLFAAVAFSPDAPQILGILFILGVIAAAYSSADSALTALTTSFTVDILGLELIENQRTRRIRILTHLAMSAAMLILIVIFKYFVSESVINEIFTIAGFTYGPLLGLYVVGMFTRWQVNDRWIPIAAIAGPLLTYLLKKNSLVWFGYTFSFELILINGALVIFGLWLLRIHK
ncbi:sodium/iodide co-transporter [Thermaurantimonas aggregans]|uniref:Sodium/iodide co-transporter n=1 Tax=Thermaurantimonas aggregans TaxID=2173829 RepID=A0A401XIE1_9FLAO|nr:sodium:solute symporter [Thermaurantimonas aggregans]MCX8149090.1 sodium:solute symporter [Thermaurantimonas aggregans]GCD76782.1 sodium/iodide co-transporter [Thermaurantimonas aggregans]